MGGSRPRELIRLFSGLFLGRSEISLLVFAFLGHRFPKASLEGIEEQIKGFEAQFHIHEFRKWESLLVKFLK